MGARRARPFPYAKNDAASQKAGLDEKDAENVDAVQATLRKVVIAEARKIVLAAVEKAKDGNYQVMKYLFEVAGLYPSTTTKSNEEDELSLVRCLCLRLGLPELESEGGVAAQTSVNLQNSRALK